MSGQYKKQIDKAFKQGYAKAQKEFEKMIDEMDCYILDLYDKSHKIRRRKMKIGNIIYKDELKQKLKQLGGEDEQPAQESK